MNEVHECCVFKWACRTVYLAIHSTNTVCKWLILTKKVVLYDWPAKMTVSNTRFTNSSWQNFIEHVYISKRTYVSTEKRDLPTWREPRIGRCGIVRRRWRRCQRREYSVTNLHGHPSRIAFSQVRARMEIRKWRFRQPEKLLIRHLPFSRFVREIEQDYMEAPRFKAEAINALHYAAESYLVRIFEDANLIARHAKGITHSSCASYPWWVRVAIHQIDVLFTRLCS